MRDYARRDAHAPLGEGIVPSERWPSIEEGLDGFFSHCQLRSLSPATVRSYRTRLKGLGTPDVPFVTPIVTTYDLTRATCSRYIADELSRSSLGTARTTWGALASFCKYGVGEGWWAESPMKGVPCPHEKVRPRYLSKDELRRLWAVVCSSRRLPDENKLIFLLLLGGLRASELCGLRWSDVREGTATVYGKGGRQRRIPLDEATVGLLRGRKRTSVLVFEMSRTSLGARVRGWGKKAGIPCHPHLFRHSFASNWLIEGGDTTALMALGGWATDAMIRSRYAKAAIEEASIRAGRRLDLNTRLLE